MRNILGKHRLQAVAIAAVVLTLLATPSAGTTQNAGATHDYDAHVHSANATAHAHSDQPHRTATLNRANPKFTWEGSGSGVADSASSELLYGQPPPLRCTDTPFRCEHILLLVEKAGELTLTLNVTDSDATSQVASGKDLDAYLYRSNPAGDQVGQTLTRDCLRPSASETCKVALGPGFYLVEVEYHKALEAHYTGTVELAVAPGPRAAQPQMVTVEDCNFTLYYFKDSAERLQALVPPGYRVRPYQPYPAYSLITVPPTGPVPGTGPIPPQPEVKGSATIAAAAYDCERIEVPGSAPAPGIFTVLSVLVYPPDGAVEGADSSDYYVLGIHADNRDLVKLLASHGMPASLVPGMVFEKPLQSLGVHVKVPWSRGAYELATTGFEQDFFHSHDNTYVHVTSEGGDCRGDRAKPRRGGCVVRLDFITNRTRDQFCSQPSDQHEVLAPTGDHHAVECGELTAEAGTPVASLFGAPDRHADSAWDHEPLERSWFVLQ
jgi:hypothetical protein